MKNYFFLAILLFMGSSGFSQNVGISTLTPLFKLDVRNGSINTDSVYRIGTFTVLSVRGTGNLLVGKNAGRINTGSNNTFSGETAGYSNTSGFGNTAYGFQALYSNINGAGNTAIGLQTLHNNIDGDANIAIGDGALYYNTGGKYNTAIGYTSLYDNIDGWYNTSNGESALTRNISGSWNTANGGHALSYNETGNKNTADGYSTLSHNTSGSLNTGLGYNSDVFTDALTNATALGANARVDCSNCLVLGSVNGVQGAESNVNVGIGVNSPGARLSISTYGVELAGSAASNAVRTNAGILGNAVDSEMSLANFGFASNNNSSLGVHAYRTSAGADWTTTSLLLEYDVDNSARVNSSYLALSANGNIGIGTVRPLAQLHVTDRSVLFSATGGITFMPGPLPMEGAGRRMMWIADKAAFRVGYVDNVQWNQTNIGNYSFASGNNTIASGQFSTAFGVNTLASSEVSIAFGTGTNATGPYSTAMGYATYASGMQSTAMGYSTHATGTISFATGNGTTASGNNSTAMGYANVASGSSSTALGFGSSASGDYSTAMGYGTNASGTFSCSLGELTTASQPAAIAMGLFTTASGNNSTAMGNATTASGSFSTTMGSETNASGENSTAMGSSTTASGLSSISMGDNTTASGYYSTAMGISTIANSYYSTAMGAGTQALGSSSTAMGNYTIAKAPGSLSIGILNDNTDTPDEFIPAPTSRLFQIGNGDGDLNTRSNALTVLYNGNMGLGTTTPAFKLSFAPVLGDKISLWSNSSSSYGFGVQGSKLQIHTDVIAADIVFGYGSSAAFTETMRIRGNGKVGIGTMTPDQALTVVGDICATGWIATCSDIRYKTELTPISNSLEKVLQLHGLYYFLKTDEFPEKSFSDKRQIGFSAQELEEQFPEIVQTDTKGFKSVDYGRMSPILLEAIKEQQRQIEALQKNEEDQQQQIDELKKLVQELVARGKE